MSKQIDTSSSNTTESVNSDKKDAATKPTVPNRPTEASKTDAASTTTAPPVDSVLVGTVKDDKRKAAEPKGADAQVVEPKVTDAKPAAATTSDVPKVEPARPASPQPKPAPVVETRVVERKGGFGSMFLGGVVAAALGAGAAYWAIPHLPEAWQPVSQNDNAALLDSVRTLAADTARSAATDAARAEVEGAKPALLGEVGDRATAAGTEAANQAIAALPKAEGGPAPTESGAVTAIQTEMTTQGDQITAQGEQIAALASAVDALRTAAPTTAPAETGAASADVGTMQNALAQLQQQVGEQAAQIAEISARPSVDPETAAKLADLDARAQTASAQIAAAADSVQSQLQAAEDNAAKVRRETEDVGRRAQISAAVAGLQAALETGGDLARGGADLKAAGVEVSPALDQPVLSLVSLQRSYDDASRAGLRASLKAESRSTGAWGAVGNFLRVQTGARSVEAKDGSDPDAILSRATVAVQTGDIGKALGEIATLPPEGQAAMTGWTDEAKKWADARAALSTLLQPSN